MSTAVFFHGKEREWLLLTLLHLTFLSLLSPAHCCFCCRPPAATCVTPKVTSLVLLRQKRSSSSQVAVPAVPPRIEAGNESALKNLLRRIAEVYLRGVGGGGAEEEMMRRQYGYLSPWVSPARYRVPLPLLCNSTANLCTRVAHPHGRVVRKNDLK